MVSRKGLRIEDLGFGRCIDDIDSDEEKIEIVKQWINKKDTEKFENIMKRIDVSNSINNFQKFIGDNFGCINHEYSAEFRMV